MLHKSEGNINGDDKCFWCSDCAQVWRQLGRVRAEQGGGQLLHNRAGQEVRNIGAAHTTPNIILMLMYTLKVIFRNLCLQVPKDHKHQLLSGVYWDWSDQGFCHQIWKNTSGDGHAHRWNGIPFDFVSIQELSDSYSKTWQGARCPVYLMTGDLASLPNFTSGWYFGSDSVRSPLHK